MCRGITRKSARLGDGASAAPLQAPSLPHMAHGTATDDTCLTAHARLPSPPGAGSAASSAARWRAAMSAAVSTHAHVSNERSPWLSSRSPPLPRSRHVPQRRCVSIV
jgi:hypothetical protein